MSLARAALALSLLAAAAPQAEGQDVRVRSRDYLFAAAVDDSRATWVNPAGLGWIPEASVTAELVVDRPPAGSLSFAQYSVGLNSRGFSVAYLRDLVGDSTSVGQLRFALGTPLRRVRVGAALSIYQGAGDGSGLDLGVRYAPVGPLSVAAVLRNIRHPQVRGIEQPLIAVASADWPLIPGRVRVAGEAAAAERLASSGYDVAYRAGLVLTAAGRAHVALTTAVDLASDGSLRQWIVGLMLGGSDRIGVFSSALSTGGLSEPERFSLVGVASRRAPGLPQTY